jgi:hypothetical protein
MAQKRPVYILWYQERKFHDVPVLSTPKSAKTPIPTKTISDFLKIALHIQNQKQECIPIPLALLLAN